MSHWKKQGLLIVVGAVTALGPIVESAHAGPILDWIRARRAARQTAYYQPAAVTAYSPVACGSCNACASPCASPCNTCASPCTTCASPCMTTQQVCNYVPQTTYRTEYAQVPVTVYRPVTTYDPCNGCPRTVMQACTTTTYQARRVPVTTYQQVCSMVQTPVAPAVQYAPVQPYAVAPQGCSTCGVPQVQQFQPAPLMQQYQAVPQMMQQQPTPMYGQAPTPQPTTSLETAPAT
ncbi:MAG: hypothetical protein KDA41_19410, partial [Planctomycetales bacterium]|nr:hypothetical protein [Planctomycetales bacterium]